MPEIMKFMDLLLSQEHFSFPFFNAHQPPTRGNPWDTTTQLCPPDCLAVQYTWCTWI